MRKEFRYLILTALLAACAQQPTTSTNPAPVASAPSGPIGRSGALQYVSNEIVVGYTDEASLKAAAAAVNGTVVATIPEIRAALVRTQGDAIKVAPVAASVEGVAYATPHSVVSGPEVPQLSQTKLGSLSNAADQYFDELPQYALDPRHLNAKAAWDAGMTGKGVIVAVLDDPGDITHPDIAPNWGGKAYNPFLDKVYTNGADWKAASQSNFASHGTFVGSTIVAARDGKGIVGLAPDSKLIPVVINPAKTQTNEFYGSFYIARGAVWAVNNGARVLNNSWGGGLSFGAVKAAFDYAMANGAVVVASMGNSYKDEVQYPGALPGIVASGALDASNRKVTFSTSGRHISSSAPGQDVILANPTWLGGGHQLISGTSFSSPYTAAAAALVIGKCPNATPYQVRRLLEETANGAVGTNPNGFDRETGWGALDLGKAAARLKDCANLPAKGANVAVSVSYVDGTGTHPGALADVILRGKGLRPGASDDSTPLYLSTSDETGEVVFSEIAPGDYDIYVAGADLDVTGGLPEERGTFVGTLTATSGSTFEYPVRKTVKLVAQSPDFNPADPYEPNDTPAEAKTIAYGQTTSTAYIFGQPRDVDVFKFTAQAGDKILAEVLAQGQLGGSLDSYLYLVGPDGTTVLKENDDRGTPRVDSDSEIAFDIPTAGTYYLKVTSCEIAPGCAAPGGVDDNSPFNKYQLSLKKTN
ncbi:S8 family serine peptidase [Deinococcus pimensis]|uniref:S8 family serine peptidase n=1 Tax=Deinococcus pimensis TaxID=309888 RepID=UPI000484BC86|nr:S8 family serine peptidase [Deinococcus pimensis]